MEDLIGGNGEENAEITQQILKGQLKGAKRDIVLLNSAMGIYIGGKAQSIEEGVKVAAEIIDSGKALAKMEEFVKLSNQ